MRLRAMLVVAVILSALLGLRAVAAAQENTDAAPRVVEMTATNYEFTPSSVHVKIGETVRLSVVAEDKEHGIRIKPVAEGSAPGTAPGLEIAGKDDCVKFKKHETGIIEFTARTPGIYKFDCCKLCGLSHGKMKGEIIVDPS